MGSHLMITTYYVVTIYPSPYLLLPNLELHIPSSIALPLLFLFSGLRPFPLGSAPCSIWNPSLHALCCLQAEL